MDRSVLEGNPHAILEGMLIGSYAMGANQGYIYVRSEYPHAISILDEAIAVARKAGFTRAGERLLPFRGRVEDFHVYALNAAGAAVAGRPGS